LALKRKKKVVGASPLAQQAPSPKGLLGRLVWLLVGSACLMGLLLFALDRNQGEAPTAGTTQAEDLPDAVFEKFHLVSTVHGVKRWELFSDTAKVFQGTKKAFADQIYAQYYKQGRLISTLTAEKAVIDTESNATKAQGHVELIVENGSKLETEDLQWDPVTDQIRTEGPVRVYKGMDDITAVGLVADTQLNNVTFLKDVETKVRDTREIEHFEKPKKF